MAITMTPAEARAFFERLITFAAGKQTVERAERMTGITLKEILEDDDLCVQFALGLSEGAAGVSPFTPINRTTH